MSFPLTTGDWVLIAAVVTVIYLVGMRWCMPTPKSKLRMSLAPLIGWIFLLPDAVVKGYSVSHTLYFYSCVLLTFVIMLVPVGKKVGADILEQEQKPWTKVPLNTFALYWVAFSGAGCIAGVVCLWPLLE